MCRKKDEYNSFDKRFKFFADILPEILSRSHPFTVMNDFHKSVDRNRPRILGGVIENHVTENKGSNKISQHKPLPSK
jgi:hypothetical protein